MKPALSGTLAQKPELKEVNGKEGEKLPVTNFTLFVYDHNAPLATRADGTSYRKGIPFKCTAWGDNAVKISQMEKGDRLTAAATARYNEHTTKDGRTIAEPNYVIRKIDHDNTLAKQQSELLYRYEEGISDRIFEQEAAPALAPGKTAGRQQGKEASKTTAQDAAKDAGMEA